MSKIHSRSHLIYWVVWPIIISFVLGGIASFLIPAYSPMQILLFQTVMIIMMTGMSALSIWTAREGWDIPAAGFILLTISLGMFVSALASSHGKINYEAGIAGVIFMV